MRKRDAYLFAQLETHESIQAKRRAIWERYDAGLRDWAHDSCVQTPFVPPYCEQAYHMYYMLLPDLQARQGLIEHLKSLGILSVFHYVSLHLSEMGRKFGGQEGMCPVTESASDRLVRLPVFHDLTEAEQTRVIEGVRSYKIRR